MNYNGQKKSSGDVLVRAGVISWRLRCSLVLSATLLQPLLATGQSLNEVARAEWSEIDLESKLWTIPAERMKSGAGHEVALSSLAIELLHALPRFESSYILTTTFGERPISGFSKAKLQIDESITELRNEVARKKLEPLTPWQFHDLRRTMRTHLSSLPIQDLVRELIIAHVKPGLHKVYDQHLYREEKRHALDLWAKKLRAIIRHKGSI